jgi:hypothetical protein
MGRWRGSETGMRDGRGGVDRWRGGETGGEAGGGGGGHAPGPRGIRPVAGDVRERGPAASRRAGRDPEAHEHAVAYVFTVWAGGATPPVQAPHTVREKRWSDATCWTTNTPLAIPARRSKERHSARAVGSIPCIEKAARGGESQLHGTLPSRAPTPCSIASHPTPKPVRLHLSGAERRPHLRTTPSRLWSRQCAISGPYGPIYGPHGVILGPDRASHRAPTFASTNHIEPAIARQPLRLRTI